jgi:biotin carboxyl carrier protein
MMKRVTWFVGGVATGAVGVGAAKRRIRNAAAELTPGQVVKRASGTARRRAQDVTEALREGRRAMRAKELELRARMDGRVTNLADVLDDDDNIDSLIVDGKEVKPGQVIALRQVRDDPSRRSRRRA